LLLDIDIFLGDDEEEEVIDEEFEMITEESKETS